MLNLFIYYFFLKVTSGTSKDTLKLGQSTGLANLLNLANPPVFNPPPLDPMTPAVGRGF